MKFIANDAEDVLAVHADHLGSPQKMTDASRAVVWDAAFTPWGEEDSITGASVNHWRFPGQYADEEAGLSYNWMRTYDPAIGRYLQSDPIGMAGGLNSYGYVGGNPISYTDPKGLFKKEVLEKAIALLERMLAKTKNGLLRSVLERQLARPYAMAASGLTAADIFELIAELLNQIRENKLTAGSAAETR